ncbi:MULTISPECIES: Spy0128 family protein [Collinsella]|uniref:Spy0128 family protein n=1 Tax=Collinsella TaxID=102106 RepID=UPI0011C10E31|nr:MULTISPECIES: FctA domain-containing protein [Collinsella]
MRSLRFEPGTVARHASDLAGHCQRCPDGFYRGNCDGGGSSSESTDVGNTNNGDTENQNSDDAAGDEADPSNGVEQGQPEGKLQAEDGELSDGNAVMLAAEGGQTKTASTEIRTADDLKKLANASGVASFKLMNDVETGETIALNKDGSNITLDLNGCKIKYTSQSQPLFNITGGATLTVKDGQQVAATETTTSQTNKCGNLALMEYDTSNGIPTGLTYYVTESVASGTRTTETLKAYKAHVKGAIVACSGSKDLRLIVINSGGHLNLESGMITQDKNNCVKNLVYAAGSSAISVDGGYVCGGYCPEGAAGAGISVENSTLDISDGVIAGNYAPSGGGVYALNSTVNMVGGIISGNGTNDNEVGYGAGICAEDSMVTITNGYITNNKYQFYTDEGHKGNGCHGGGGIAAFSHNQGQKKGGLVISGGYITGNYSAEAGGGVYAGAWNKPLSGFAFYGGIIASNVAQNSEGGGIRIAAPTVGEFNVSGKKAYITNNTTNTTNDWGGGGVFVQGSSDNNVQPASLNIYNALITNNHASGFGGGFAACPTGKTAITDTNGIAIFGNYDGKPDGSGYNRSGGTHDKNDDADWRPNHEGGEITEDFKKAGHQDLFLIRDSANAESLPYIAAVTGQMLGGGAANWSGTIDKTPTSIGKYEGAQAKYMIGLKSEPIQYDKDAATAAASLFITGNRSNIHGGGVMTNGDVIAGSTTQVNVYSKMKLNGTKALEGRALTADDAGKFRFQLLEPGESGGVPSFNNNDDGKLQLNGCSIVGDDDGATNDAEGNFVFDLGRVHSAGTNVYYLVEDPGNVADRVPGVDYDQTIYKIELTTTTEERPVLDIDYIYFLVTNVRVTNLKNNEAKTFTPNNGSDVSIKITDGNTDKTFTNAYKPKGSWTPQVTKKVDGGEMKAFTFELANEDDPNFTKPETVTINPDPANVKTEKNGNATSTVDFKSKTYKLTDLNNGSKTFTYYVREKYESSTYPHYKFDQSVYRFKVVAKDNTQGGIDCAVTYRKGTVDPGGTWKDTDNKDHEFPDTTPTFTNTYSTSLPLSGMSGVTLTYLAGAAALCAAAAWMHIRRKANAKGGERRE